MLAVSTFLNYPRNSATSGANVMLAERGTHRPSVGQMRVAIAPGRGDGAGGEEDSRGHSRHDRPQPPQQPRPLALGPAGPAHAAEHNSELFWAAHSHPGHMRVQASSAGRDGVHSSSWEEKKGSVTLRRVRCFTTMTKRCVCVCVDASMLGELTFCERK